MTCLEQWREGEAGGEDKDKFKEEGEEEEEDNK